ncbi:toxin 1 [Pelomyxa schiedti]|nr:toxin 1 [Pelomyxa schiedti]
MSANGPNGDPAFLAAVVLWLFRLERSRVPIYFPGVRFRTETVPDYRDRNGQRVVPRQAERLVRWDRRNPDTIFAMGFVPQEEADEIQNDPHSDALNLSQFVAENTPSVFVSTARYYNVNGQARRWQPRNRTNTFEYEIYAPGGIDVNATLGQHQYCNQREVAFPGGIRREYIRLAREFDHEGHIVNVWINPAFQPPPEVVLPAVSSTVQQRTWVQGSCGGGRVLRSEIPSNNFNECMFTDGDGAEDPLDIGSQTKITSVRAWGGWLVDSIEVATTDGVNKVGGPGGGLKIDLQLRPGEYIVEVCGRVCNVLVLLILATNQRTTPSAGGADGQNHDGCPFSFRAPPGHMLGNLTMDTTTAWGGSVTCLKSVTAHWVPISF